MIIGGTLSRYFGMRFLPPVVGSFVGVVALAAMIDYVELMRRGADWPNATAWVLAKISMYRVPQLTERIMPFSVLVGAMSCYLALSRRLELVVARAAGVSAWQFVAPAMIAAFVFGTIATTLYNPVAAVLHERSKRLEAEMLGELPSSAVHENTSGFWVRQRSTDGAAIINAKSSRQQGSQLGNVSVYTFDHAGHSLSGSRQRPRSSSRATGGSRTRASTKAAVRRTSRKPIALPPRSRSSRCARA